MGWKVAREQHSECEFFPSVVESSVVGAVLDGVGVLGLELDVGDEGLEGAWPLFANPVRFRDFVARFWLTGVAQAFRHLNAVTVPKMIHVPKNEEEDAKKGN